MPAVRVGDNGPSTVVKVRRHRACAPVSRETAILYRLGRLDIAGTLLELFAAGLSADVQVLELTPAIAAKTNDLPANFRGDPFDRTIVATAAALNLKLITADPVIRDAKMCAVEYYPFKPWRSRT